MMKEFKKARIRIILILSLMIFLLTYCFMMYTGLGTKEKNNSIEIMGNDNLVSQRLAEIIPFNKVLEKPLKTAYQGKKVTSENIDNKIFLMKAYQNTDTKTQKNFNKVLERLYGNNLFIVYEDFNVNENITCHYESNLMNYTCINTPNNSIVYDAIRNTIKLNIKDDDYTLEEEIIFYSKELVGVDTIYKIYKDGNFNEVITSFTDKEVNKEIDIYLTENYANYSQKYISNFRYNNNTYRWLNTNLKEN